MTLSRAKPVTTITLDAETTRLLDRAAREQGISRSQFVRRQLRRALEQFREHPRPRSAGVIKGRLRECADESELFRDLER
ncbi:MAG: ribbon-helix-helix protein, CopG family [Deltaproteobacteria bacterium]|nr:ribbon-helix-helix protein, CopG family [Deltaproteobacteria bacterium]